MALLTHSMQCCLLAGHKLTGVWTCSGTLAASHGGSPAPRCAIEQHSGRVAKFCSLVAEARARPYAALSRSLRGAHLCAGRRGRRGQGDADAHPQRRPQVPHACGPLVERTAAAPGAPDVPARCAAAQHKALTPDSSLRTAGQHAGRLHVPEHANWMLISSCRLVAGGPIIATQVRTRR